MTWAKSHNTTAPLWFRRWSRSRAAVFHSLGQAVVIGHLRATVLARLERKTATLIHRTWQGSALAYPNKWETEREDTEKSCLHEALLPEQTTEITNATDTIALPIITDLSISALTLYPYICRGVRSELCLYSA